MTSSETYATYGPGYVSTQEVEYQGYDLALNEAECSDSDNPQPRNRTEDDFRQEIHYLNTAFREMHLAIIDEDDWRVFAAGYRRGWREFRECA